MLTTLLGSQWRHRSIYCDLVVKMGICPSRGPLIKRALLSLSGGRYLAAELYGFIRTHWVHFA